MNDQEFAKEYARELEDEYASSLKCLERFKMDLFNFKPHETSMEMGYLACLVGEIPLWIEYIVKEKEIDLATFPHLKPESVEDLVKSFKENVQKAKKALEGVTDGSLDEDFSLKTNGTVVYKASKRENLYPAINHLVHHRGQLTVYMRMNGIDIPSIYGPSADDKTFDKGKA